MNWQPIATAPRDGTEFQAWVEYSTGEGEWFPRAKFLPHHHPDCYGQFQVYRWIQAYHEEDFEKEDGITHWMPQPGKPEDPPLRHGWRQDSELPMCGDRLAIRPSDHEFWSSNSNSPICETCTMILESMRGTTNESRQGVARAKDETL